MRLLRRLVDEAHARHFEREVHAIAPRRVMCEDPAISWEERRVADGTTLFAFFNSDIVHRLVLSALDTDVRLLPPVCWAATYRVGEYIRRHRDVDGDVQLVLCLRGVDPANGGVLKLQSVDGWVDYVLEPGDALVFRASAVEHCTSPLVATPACPEPIRIVAVARYFRQSTAPATGAAGTTAA